MNCLQETLLLDQSRKLKFYTMNNNLNSRRAEQACITIRLVPKWNYWGTKYLELSAAQGKACRHHILTLSHLRPEHGSWRCALTLWLRVLRILLDCVAPIVGVFELPTQFVSNRVYILGSVSFDEQLRFTTIVHFRFQIGIGLWKLAVEGQSQDSLSLDSVFA